MGGFFSSLFYAEPLKIESITKYKDEQRVYVADKNRDFWIGTFEKKLFQEVPKYTAFRKIGN